jgi:hypothetical protein
MKAAPQAKSTAKASRKEASRPVSPLFEPVSTDPPSMVQTKCACGGSCPTCQDKLKIQTKLTVSEPNDPYEQEADQTAEQVMRTPESATQTQSQALSVTSIVQRTAAPPAIQRAQAEPIDDAGMEEDEPVSVQTAAAPESAPPPPDEPPLENALESMRGRGIPLPRSERQYFERRFGRDFSRVRVHTGHGADRAARSVQALAFATGHDVVFRSGFYAPHNHAGRKLLAHELTHVVQQGRAPPLASTQNAPTQVRGPPTRAGHGPVSSGKHIISVPVNGRELAGRSVPEAGIPFVQRQPSCAAPLAQQAAKNALQAALAGKYRPVHMGPTFGTAIHVKILERLRSANPSLVTEAPIPGTNKSTAGHDLLGEADLYMSEPASTVSGIKGAKGAAPPQTYEQTRGCGTKGATKYSPDFDAAAASPHIKGSFVTDFWVGDLKPTSRTEVRNGNRQLNNYRNHYTSWANAAIAAGATGPAPAGHLLPEGDGNNHTVKIPDELSYKKFATQKTGSGGLLEGTDRIWIWHLKDHEGIFLYFDLPATFNDTDTGVASRLKALDARLTEINAPIKQAPTKVNKKAGIAQPKRCPSASRALPQRTPKYKRPAPGRAVVARSSTVRHRRRPIHRRGMLQRNLGTASSDASRLIQRNVPPTDLQDWKTEHSKWSGDVEKVTKDNSSIVRKMYFDDIFGLSSPTNQGTAKLLGKLDLWAGLSGTILGTLGWTFRSVIAKFAPFFDKVKAKFQDFKKRFESWKTTRSGRWFMLILHILAGVAKIVFHKLMDHAYTMLANCVNGMIDGAFGEVKQWLESFDEVKELEDEALKPINAVVEQFKQWEEKAKSLFSDLESRFGTFLAFVQDATEIINDIRTLEIPLRLLLEAISCGTPPAWGCLWGLVGQLAFDTVLSLGLQYLEKTETFQKMMNDLACSTVKKQLQEWYGGVLRSVVEAVGLTGYAEKVNAPCKFTQEESDFKCEMPVSGGTPEQQQGAATRDGALMGEMKRLTLPNIDIVPGQTAGENDVQQFLIMVRDAGIDKAKFKKCMKVENGRAILSESMPCLLTPPPSGGAVAQGGGGSGGGAGSSGGSGADDGTMTDQGGESANGDSSGQSPRGKPGTKPSGGKQAGSSGTSESEGDSGGGGAQSQGGGGASGDARSPAQQAADARETAEGLINRMLELLPPEGDDAGKLRELKDSLKGSSNEIQPEGPPVSQAPESGNEPASEVADASEVPDTEDGTDERTVMTKCACGGSCSSCQNKQRMPGGLTVSEPDEPYEREADQVADEIMRMPDPRSTGMSDIGSLNIVQRKCACGGTCADCQKPHYGDEHSHLQMKAGGAGAAGGIEAPPVVHEVLIAPGRPLDEQTRAFMESRFGRDFRGVRVHANEKAAESARALGARAYTVRNNIVFDRGEFAPGSREGQRLLGHELTHVVQQSGSRGTVTSHGNNRHGVMRAPQTAVKAESRPEQEHVTWIEDGKGGFSLIPRPGMTINHIAAYVTGYPEAPDYLADLNGLSRTAPIPPWQIIKIPVDYIDSNSRAFREMPRAMQIRIASAQTAMSEHKAYARFTTIRPGPGIGLIPVTTLAGKGFAQLPSRLIEVLGRPFKALVKFFECLLKSLSGEVFQSLENRIGLKLYLAMSISFGPGVLWGATREIGGIAKQIASIISQPIKFIYDVLNFVGLLFSPKASELGCAMGEDMGEALNKEIAALSPLGDFRFALELGKLAGPLLLNTLLALIAPEIMIGLRGTRIGRRLLALLEKMGSELNFLNKWRKPGKRAAVTVEKEGFAAELGERVIADADKFIKEHPPGKIHGVVGERRALLEGSEGHEVREVFDADAPGGIACEVYSNAKRLHGCPQGLGAGSATEAELKANRRKHEMEVKEGPAVTATDRPPDEPEPASSRDKENNPSPRSKEPGKAVRVSERDEALALIRKAIDKVKAKLENAQAQRARILREIRKNRENITVWTEQAKVASGEAKTRLERKIQDAKKALDEDMGGGLNEELRGNHREEYDLEKKIRTLEASLTLGRPPITPAFEKAIQAEAGKMGLQLPGGRWKDPNTYRVIEGQPVYGHRFGFEHRRLALSAAKKGMNQTEFNAWVYKHPEWFQIESIESNSLHIFEKPGIEGWEDL